MVLFRFLQNAKICEANISKLGFRIFSVILQVMPVTKQAIKKVRQDRRKTVINLRVKKNFKAAVLAFRKKPTAGGLRKVFVALDRAAKTNVIHKNKASRLKSRLSKLIAPTKKQVPTSV